MNIPESFSIRQRVFTLGAVLLACALIGLVFFLRGYAQRAAEQAFDRLLAASALTIAGSVQIEDNEVTVEPPVSSLAMLSGGRMARDLFGGVGPVQADDGLREIRAAPLQHQPGPQRPCGIELVADHQFHGRCSIEAMRHQWLDESFSTTRPETISTTPPIRIGVRASPSTMTPTTKAPTAPMPVQMA